MTGSSPGPVASEPRRNQHQGNQHLEGVLSLLSEALSRLDSIDLCPAIGAQLNDVIISLEALRDHLVEAA